jgi:hypothetical protein
VNDTNEIVFSLIRDSLEIYEFGKDHMLPTVTDNPYVPTGDTITIKAESTNTPQTPNPNVSRCRC